MRALRYIRKTAKFAFLACLALVLYAIASSSGAGWLYVISAGMGGVLVVSALVPLYNVRGIEAHRKAPPVGTAGESLRCEMEIRNRGRLARHLLEVRDDFAGGTGGGVVVRVRRGAPEGFEYEIEASRRGVYSGGEVTVESGAPFGVFHGRRRMRVASHTTIYPRTFEVAGLPRPASSNATGTEREESYQMHRGLGGEFWGVREYRPGDPARLIAWRQSARSLAAGRLSVVELAQETSPPLGISLDLDPRAPSEVREMIVSAAASLMLYALKEGREVLADAGPQHSEFPEMPDEDGILSWCAGLIPSRPPTMEWAGVAILPFLKDIQLPAAETVVLVSCYEFAGSGAWMTPDEERAFVDRAEAEGRRVARLGPDVREPWRIS